MSLKNREYSPFELMGLVAVPVTGYFNAVSVGQAIEHINYLGELGSEELEHGGDGIDALAYHLSGIDCEKTIETMQKVLKRFEELKN